jgi:small neutral amino acid transporter SnatA (MarC family)
VFERELSSAGGEGGILLFLKALSKREGSESEQKKRDTTNTLELL